MKRIGEIAMAVALVGLAAQEEPWIAYWDHSGFAGFDELGNPAELVAVEYVAAELVTDPTTAAPGMVYNRVTEDLRQDWAEALRAAGVSEELINSFAQNYRADVIDGLVESLNPGRYSLWARVQNSQGRWSTWTLSQDIIGIASRPDPPRNLRCANCQ